MKNCDAETPTTTRANILSKFAQKVVNSGHSHSACKKILVNGLTKYYHEVRRDSLGNQDVKYKPLHLAKTYREFDRQIEKQMLKTNFYKSSKKDQSWRRDVPRKWKFNDFGQRRNKEMDYSTIMEVPNTAEGALLRCLAKEEPKLSKITNYQVKYVEQSGVQLGNMFPRKILRSLTTRLNMLSKVESNLETCSRERYYQSAATEQTA